MKKSVKATNCPFCGKKPKVTPYPNGKGASVQCNTVDCALWPYSIDLEEWNRRAITLSHVIELLFDRVTVYGTDFKPVVEYRCSNCGRMGTNIKKLKHDKYCKVKKMVDVM